MNEQSENEEIKVPGVIGTTGCVLRGTCVEPRGGSVGAVEKLLMAMVWRLRGLG